MVSRNKRSIQEFTELDNCTGDKELVWFSIIKKVGLRKLPVWKKCSWFVTEIKFKSVNNFTWCWYGYKLERIKEKSIQIIFEISFERKLQIMCKNGLQFIIKRWQTIALAESCIQRLFGRFVKNVPHD